MKSIKSFRKYIIIMTYYTLRVNVVGHANIQLKSSAKLFFSGLYTCFPVCTTFFVQELDQIWQSFASLIQHSILTNVSSKEPELHEAFPFVYPPKLTIFIHVHL